MTLHARVCLLLATVAVVAHGAKFEFADASLGPLAQVARRHAMFIKADAPSTGSPGNGASTVSINVAFNSKEGSTAPENVLVIFFHQDQLDNVHKADQTGNFCCTRSTPDGPYGCTVGGIFTRTFTPVFLKSVTVQPNQTANLEQDVQVEKTGMHYLMYSNCLGSSTVLIKGHNSWLNPYGFLPGDLYSTMPFFLSMSLLNALAVGLWFVLICYYRTDGVLPVQYHIGGVAVVALVEAVAWYVHFSYFNETGYKAIPLLTAAVIFSTLKKVTTRILILVVCMGYGIVKPTLGDNATKVMVFALLYTVFTTILDVVKALSHEDDISGGFFILVIVPVALLDSIFYYWTFVSLYDVVAALEERKQTDKLNLYRKFLCAVTTCLVFSLGWVLFQMWFLYTEQFTVHWEYSWLLNDGYWYVLGFVVLVFIMVLWRPSANSMSYAFHEQISSCDDDLDGIELDDNTAAAFSIGDDDEEDSRFNDAEAGLADLDSELTGDSKDDI